MSLVRSSVFTAILLFVAVCYPALAQADGYFNPKEGLQVEWQLVKNDHPGKNQFVATLTLKNTSNMGLPAIGWKILFDLRYHGTALTSLTRIEAPGHARAAIKSMQHRYEKYMDAGHAVEALSNQYFRDNEMDVTLPSTNVFLEKIIDELKRVYQESGARFEAIHLAGDEVPHGSWELSPARIAFGKSHPEVVTADDLWKYLTVVDAVEKLLQSQIFNV